MNPASFFGRNYEETMALLLESRAWIADCEPRERQQLDAITRIRLSCETMRLTARLTQAMAWLMAQRAIHSGQMSPDEAIDGQAALSSVKICMEHAPPALDGLPRSLVSLLERSHMLYERLARLDDGLRRPEEQPASGQGPTLCEVS